MKLEKIILIVYTWMVFMSLLILVYLHVEFPGYYVHYGILVLNYNSFVPYLIVVLVYLGAILELYGLKHLISFVRRAFN